MNNFIVPFFYSGFTFLNNWSTEITSASLTRAVRKVSEFGTATRTRKLTQRPEVHGDKAAQVPCPAKMSSVNDHGKPLVNRLDKQLSDRQSAPCSLQLKTFKMRKELCSFLR